MIYALQRCKYIFASITYVKKNLQNLNMSLIQVLASLPSRNCIFWKIFSLILRYSLGLSTPSQNLVLGFSNSQLLAKFSLRAVTMISQWQREKIAVADELSMFNHFVGLAHKGLRNFPWSVFCLIWTKYRDLHIQRKSLDYLHAPE